MKAFLAMWGFIAATLSVPMFIETATLYQYSDQDGYIILTDQPCSTKVILNITPPDVVASARHWEMIVTSAEMRKQLGKNKIEGCYIIDGEFVHYINEFLTFGTVPLSDFVKVKQNSI